MPGGEKRLQGSELSSLQPGTSVFCKALTPWVRSKARDMMENRRSVDATASESRKNRTDLTLFELKNLRLMLCNNLVIGEESI